MASRASWRWAGPLSLGPALLFAACSSRSSFEPLPSGDTRAVVAVQFEGRQPESVSVHRPSPEGGIELELEEHRDLVLFFLEHHDFVDPEGQHLTDEQWSALRVSGADSSAPGCGRCAVPNDVPPFSVMAGDSCSIGPTVAEALIIQTEERREEELIPAARNYARLDWPGSCGCAPPDPAPNRLEACAVGAAPEAITPKMLRFGADASLVGLSPSHLIALESSGSQAMKLEHDLGGIQFFEPLPSGDWIIGQSTRLAMANLEDLVQLYSPSFERKILRGIPHDRIRCAGTTARGTWLFGGYGISSLPGRFGPRLEECAPTVRADGVTELACQRLELPESPCYVESAGGTGAIEAIFDTPAGELAFTGFGEMYFRARGATSFRCVERPASADGGWTFASAPATQARLGAAVVAGGRVHMLLRDGDQRAFIISTPATREALDGSLGLAEWAVATDVPYALNEAMHGPMLAFTLPATSSLAYFRMIDLELEETIYAVDDRGELAGEWRGRGRQTALAALFPELTGLARLRSIASSAAGHLAVLTDDQLVHVGSGAGPLTRLRSNRPSFFPVDLVVSWPDGVQLALGSTRAFSLDAATTCEGAALEAWPVPFELPSAPKLAAARPGAAREAWVHGEGWTGILDLERGLFTRHEAAGERALRAIAGLNSSVAVAISEEGNAYFLENGGEDLETPARLNDQAWLSVGAAGGVAWLSGWTRLARVRAGPGGLIVETDWLDRAEYRFEAPEIKPVLENLGTIDALCPGDVAMWGEDVSGRERVLRLFTLRSDPRALLLSAAPLVTTDSEVFSIDPLEPIYAQWVENRPVVVAHGGYVASGEVARVVMPFRSLQRPAGGPGSALVVGERTSLGARVGFLRRRSP